MKDDPDDEYNIAYSYIIIKFVVKKYTKVSSIIYLLSTIPLFLAFVVDDSITYSYHSVIVDKSFKKPKLKNINTEKVLGLIAT